MISFTQILLLLSILFLIFGDFSKIRKNISKNLNSLKKLTDKNQENKKIK